MKTYEHYAHELVTHGAQTLSDVREFVGTIGREFTANEVIQSCCARRGAVDCFHVLNALDYCRTLGLVMELTGESTWGQHRRYKPQ